MDGKVKNIRFCEVISTYDPYDAGRIKVRIKPIDNNKKDEELPYAIPLLPKTFHISPKVGEGVFVMLSHTNDGDSQRYYIGPIISQYDFLYKNVLFYGSDAIFGESAPESLIRGIQTVKEMSGTFPQQDDVAILGRKNTDIILTEDDVRIRAGVKLVDEKNKYKITFNETTPSYFKLKYHPIPLAGETQNTATIVANKINLLSTQSNRRRPNGEIENIGSFTLNDRNDLVTDQELETILNEGYRLPYGEELVNFLKTFVKAFLNHTHPYPMLKPAPGDTIEKLNRQTTEMLDNERMLSDTIRIN